MKLKDKFIREISKYKDNLSNFNITEFLIKELRILSLLRRKKDIVELIPTILEYTYAYNYNWMNHPKLTSINGFQTKLLESLKQIDVYEKGLCFQEVLLKIPAQLKYTREFLEHILSYDLYDRDIKGIFQDLCTLEHKDAGFFLDSIKNETPELWSRLTQICATTHYNLLNEKIDLFLQRTNDYSYLLDNIHLTEENVKKVEEYIDQNISIILNPNNIGYWYRLYKTCSIENKERIIDYLADNIELLLKDFPDKFKFKETVESDYEIINKDRLYKAYDEYIEKNFKPSIARVSIYDPEKRLPESTKTNAYLNNEFLVDMLYMIFEELCRNEGVTFKDVKYLNGGYYSRVYAVGDKVVKIGHMREIFKFPNNPYVIAPILRKRFDIQDSNIEELYVEIQERVELVEEETVDEEELYRLYKNIRKLGLIWFDVSARNVGRLIKDNVIHWKGKIAQIDEVLNFEPKRGTVTLQAGELVVLDADFIFDEITAPEKYYSSTWGYCELQKKFERRYQEELAINNKYSYTEPRKL